MDYAARSEANNALYAPSASIALASPDRDMLRDHGLAFSQVEVDLQLSVGGQFSFTVPNCFDAARGEFLTLDGTKALDLLTLGTKVWIRMGYGDRSGQTLLMSGYITSVATNFAEAASPDLEVRGMDCLYELTLGTSTHHFPNMTVKQAVEEVARTSGLTLKFDGDPPKSVTLDSNMQTDLEFLRKLAETFSTPKKKWEFYGRPQERGAELHFRPRQVQAEPVGALTWGIDLLSFKPEANLGDQVGKVEILGWDEVQKTQIKGEATRSAGDTPSPGRATRIASEVQRNIFGKPAVLQLRYPVRSKEEADQRAEAELAKRAENFVGGEGETFGFPELVPDTRVKLEGLGTMFSLTYYVEKTVHRFDSNGYRTRFSLRSPTVNQGAAA